MSCLYAWDGDRPGRRGAGALAVGRVVRVVVVAGLFSAVVDELFLKAAGRAGTVETFGTGGRFSVAVCQMRTQKWRRYFNLNNLLQLIQRSFFHICVRSLCQLESSMQSSIDHTHTLTPHVDLWELDSTGFDIWYGVQTDGDSPWAWPL